MGAAPCQRTGGCESRVQEANFSETWARDSVSWTHGSTSVFLPGNRTNAPGVFLAVTTIVAAAVAVVVALPVTGLTSNNIVVGY